MMLALTVSSADSVNARMYNAAQLRDAAATRPYPWEPLPPGSVRLLRQAGPQTMLRIRQQAASPGLVQEKTVGPF